MVKTKIIAADEPREKAPRPREAHMELENPEFVVAIDFGTTYSKAAYAVAPHLETGILNLEKIVHMITDWPYQEMGGGAKNFKTRSCSWYMPGPEPETYELKCWGWEAYVKYKNHAEEVAMTGMEAVQPREEEYQRISSRQQEVSSRGRGYLLQDFKLWLYPTTDKKEQLPKGLSTQKVITDFLNGMSEHILRELQNKYGNKVSHRQIQWCITVPAIWDDWARKVMEECVELAGLVQGPLCKNDHASAYDLITVVEPEAASIYCHNTLKALSGGDTFIVVDLGGGTTDLVTHKKIGRTTRSNVRVKEIGSSVGDLHGGAHVDERFLEHMRKKICTPGHSCFEEFERNYPAQVLDILLNWGRIKTSFGGGEQHKWSIPLPRKLAKSWKKQRKLHAASVPLEPAEDMTNYSVIQLRSENVERIFDREVGPILKLIEQRVGPYVDFILVVGGFSESPYVRKKIQERFNQRCGRSPTILFPRNSDSAVVRGAVALGFRGEWERFIKSRIAKRTYGFNTTLPFKENFHPQKYKIHQRDESLEPLCDHIFETFIEKGQEVGFNDQVEYETCPLYRRGLPDVNNVVICIFSTAAPKARYVLDKGVTKEASCVIPVPTDYTPGKKPTLRIRIHFGGTRIRMVVWGWNFCGETIAMCPVRLVCSPRNFDDDYCGDDDERLQKRRC